jgi:integrase
VSSGKQENKNLALQSTSSPLERWLKNFAPYTQYRYKQRYDRFVEIVREHRGVQADDRALLEMAKKDTTAYSELLVDAYRHLRNQHYSPRYAAGVYDAMRSFAHYNGVDNLGKTPRVIEDESVYSETEPLTDNEVKRTEFAALTTRHGLRNAAIIAVLRESGQRRGILTALTWGMVKKPAMAGGVVIVNVVGPLLDAFGRDVRKVKRPYRFGWGAEASALVRKMMEDRTRKGEPIDDDSYLFRSYATLQEGASKPHLVPDDVRGPPVTEDIIWRVVVNAAKVAGVQKERRTDRGGTVYRVQPKAFRPYFKAKVREAFQKGAFANMTMNFDFELVKHLMGQTCAYGDAYDRFSEPYLREFYSLIDGHLSLEDKTQAPTYKHKVVVLEELASYLDQGYELLKELAGSKYLLRVKA